MADHIVKIRDCRDRVRYDGDRREFQSYIDGYFGRPLFPAEAYLMRRLDKGKIEELETAFDKAEAELAARPVLI